jgi:ABC-2 type transport system permease protein
VGMLMRSPSTVMNSGFMALFPLIFLSNIFVNPATLPGPLETFVGLNPVSHLVTAVRGLMAGSVTAGQIGLVLAATAVLTAVFAPLTVHLYRRKS